MNDETERIVVSSPGRVSPRVAVIGGGIAGLAAAHRLVELAPKLNFTLLEANRRLGGVLETVRSDDGFCVERSADNFITAVPWGIDLCRRIGLEDQLIETDDTNRRAFVVSRGKLEEIPEGFLIMAPSRIGPIVKTPILSARGKLRLLSEYFVRTKRDDTDESVASFAIRRLGRETFERLVQPLVGSIYTADPDKLSLKATLPRFIEMEQKHGSLTGATLKRMAKRTKDSSSSGARYSMFVAPAGGTSQMVDAIAARLPDGAVRLNTRVQRLERDPDGRWILRLENETHESLTVDALIVATPSYTAASLLQDVDGQLAAQLQRIPHAPCAIVSLGYRREQIGHPLNGFGYVTPLVEQRQVLSASFSSVKYRGRAPQDCELFRVFIGGACQAELLDHSDTKLRSMAERDLAEMLMIKGDPVFDYIARWPPTMPQYHVGHTQLVQDITTRAARLPGLHLAGNAYHGVGMPHCIHDGESAAQRVVTALDRD